MARIARLERSSFSGSKCAGRRRCSNPVRDWFAGRSRHDEWPGSHYIRADIRQLARPDKQVRDIPVR